MTPRDINIRIPFSEDEHEQIKTLATEADTDITKLVRSWLRDAWKRREKRLASEAPTPSTKKGGR